MALAIFIVQITSGELLVVGVYALKARARATGLSSGKSPAQDLAVQRAQTRWHTESYPRRSVKPVGVLEVWFPHAAAPQYCRARALHSRMLVRQCFHLKTRAACAEQSRRSRV